MHLPNNHVHRRPVPVTSPRQAEALVDPILCPVDSQATITHYETLVRDFDTVQTTLAWATRWTALVQAVKR